MIHDKGIYRNLLGAQLEGRKHMAVLIDPDKASTIQLDRVLLHAMEAGVDYLFIGGSLLLHGHLDSLLDSLRSRCDIPLVLFPGNTLQISHKADALLLLSLISGRNPELLIGQHVIAAPHLKRTPLELISTGYMLIDGGANSSVQYMSNTLPIPADKNEIAVCTALAGEMLGLKTIYLEAGSGALRPVPESMVTAVREAVSVPLIVGGGIRTPEQAARTFAAGADLIVIGTAFEHDPQLINELAACRK